MNLVYISGSGRSGTTLLDMLVGSQPNYFSGGELCNLLGAYYDGEYCACGDPVKKCEVWTSIIKSWSERNNLSDGDVLYFSRLDYKYSHPRKILSWLRGGLPFSWGDYEWYLKHLKSLFEIIAEYSGCDYVVDSSKSPVRLLHLRKIFCKKLLIIHLLKSPYNIINSLSKSWPKDIERGVQNEIPARHPIRTAMYWVVINYMIDFAIMLSGERSFKLKYENIVRDPEGSMGKIFPGFSLKTPLSGKHICAGNRMRMKKQIYIENKNRHDTRFGVLVDWILFVYRKRLGY